MLAFGFVPRFVLQKSYRLLSARSCSSFQLANNIVSKMAEDGDAASFVLDEHAMKKFYVPLTTKVPSAECSKAFELLSDKEKRYVHYWSKASWVGGLITFLQTSPESPAIFVLLQNLFRHSKLEELEKLAKSECGFSDDDWLALKFYAGGVYHNMGNYVGFGDTKLVPEVEKEKLKKLVFASEASSKKKEMIDFVWKQCGDPMYDLENPRIRQLGLKPEGITTYFSWNCDKRDTRLVKDFLEHYGIDAYNSRVFKTHPEGGLPRYEIRLASATEGGHVEVGQLKANGEPIEYKKNQYVITTGDYAPFMKEMSSCLKDAVKQAANDNEREMLENYIKSFETGSLNAHKDGSRFWIKNKQPVVEGYIGFIETYRDPSGQRGEFEGFVAVVDKAKSARLVKLVDAAESIISKLPWPKEYEKDQYLRPDYSELTVVSFASSGVPIGINIPNYDEIRQNEGFKNVSLGNIIAAALKSRPPQFISAADHELLTKHETLVLEIQVALHELLGHGSGKLLQQNKDGTFNFPKGLEDYESGSECAYYEAGQTYDSVFGALASTYEECRAETIAVYLCLLPEVLDVWHIAEKDRDDIIYCIWLAMAVSGIKSLPYYILEQEKWGQAHAQGRFAILRVMEEAEVVKVDIVDGSDGKPDLLVTLKRDLIKTKGKDAIEKFLSRLQLYKSTAHFEEAFTMYTEYTAVLNMPPLSETFVKWHAIAVDRRVPRNLLVQSNTFIDDSQNVTIKSYPPSIDGMIQSFQERYDHPEILEDALLKCAERDSVYFTAAAL
ncbi:dipeptidyl peptidase 3-like [Paramacrobiotus metropolitanus]|uniref:dipeptidyl peptidase 3-like n=1 Tax=Paramacrobiotus metropolitanus TaxID=2943436 RepID=UPI0024463A05|nr:dipeptidyl peptidase 3-like [Paramacrobiotus metropolitanus]